MALITTIIGLLTILTEIFSYLLSIEDDYDDLTVIVGSGRERHWWFLIKVVRLAQT